MFIPTLICVVALFSIAQTRSPISCNILPKNGGQNRLSLTHRPTHPETVKPVLFIHGSDTIATSERPGAWHGGLNDGSTGSFQNPNRSVSAARAFSVTPAVTNRTGSSSTSSVTTAGLIKVIRAASASFADVSAAVSKAKAGDTVIVPAGSASWANQLVATKGINLIGAGIGKTVIIGNYAASGDRLSSLAYLVVYRPANPELNEPFRLSGFSFNCNNKCDGIFICNYPSIAVINKVRVDHNRIYNVSRAMPFAIFGHVYGVADNNTFEGCYISVDYRDDKTWNNLTYEFGSGKGFYFEDNIFVGGHVDRCIIRSEMGAMWVARYNMFDASSLTASLYPWFDEHGNIPGAHHSVMGAELYENTITMPGGAASIYDVLITQVRGGKALVYNNISYSRQAYLQVREEYLDFLNAPANNPLSGQPQHVSDTYFWNNRLNGTDLISVSINQSVNYGGSMGLLPRPNRDYWFQGATFDGTSGVGFGPLSGRPNTCTLGVGYWATDTKTLYKCTSTNTWIAYYTPYVYPHPLRTLLSN